ncbi:Pls/PosA family non-ribosomal peptide synthetase [Agilicoccus flavus]|uniref:Pls/PosA family non-ribosomal peptide synthetase n=1 Tax=Agilicoccus flavus TaxID=2775968 RepID=UPI001CF6677B|nr:Pls/PosA family non-ribosomal peptide synthetase [Agilicoccus flavus]
MTTTPTALAPRPAADPTAPPGLPGEPLAPAAESLAGRLAAVLAEVLGVGEVAPGSRFFDDLGADSMTMARFCARVRKAGDLPAIAMRDVYAAGTVADLARALAPDDPAEPAGAGQGGTGGTVAGAATGTVAEAATGTVAEAATGTVAEAATGTVAEAATVTVAESAAGVVAKNATVSVAHDAGAWAVNGETVRAPALDPAPIQPPAGATAGLPRNRPIARAVCGTMQLSWLVAYGTLNLYVLLSGFQWVSVASTVADVYGRALVVGCGIFTVWATLPIALKWLLVGRWRVREFPLWGGRYLCFWIVKTAIRANPLALLFAGSPLTVLYLRALGARIGPGAVVLTRHLPVCTDLVTLGAGVVVRQEVHVNGYRARDGVIETGRIGLGDRAYVGESSVLDIGTALGDDAQLGHASALYTGQVVPAGESWHGTPAVPSPVTYRLEPSAESPDGYETDEPDRFRRRMDRRDRARRVGYSLVQVATTVFVGLPLSFGLVEALLSRGRLEPLLHPEHMLLTDRWIYLEAALAVLVWTLGLIAIGLLVARTLPRLLARGLVAGREYPLYGWHYGKHRLVARLTNIPGFMTLFGDASDAVGYLGAIGYRLRPIEQTGSNFGQMVTHENPYLSTVGRGTVVADGLRILNVDYGPRTFRLREARIGARNFLGNHVVYPAGGRTGDNVLLATKVAVPLDGPVRENVGLLGSPAFEIPRTVRRDTALGLLTRAELRRRLRAKSRHNRVTMALYLGVRALLLYLILLVAGLVLEFSPVHGPVVLPAAAALLLLLPIPFWVLVERVYAGLQLLTPQGCSIYDRAFWGHERYWKGPGVAFVALYNGTPIKGVLWRLLGVRVGRGLFDDGCLVPERRFLTLGDDCVLNEGSNLQCHSQEDGAFKSGLTALGDRCTVGVGALVHYGVTVGDDVQIAPASFVMKGEEVPTGARWGGNPALPLEPADAHAVPCSSDGRPPRGLPTPAPCPGRPFAIGHAPRTITPGDPR